METCWQHFGKKKTWPGKLRIGTKSCNGLDPQKGVLRRVVGFVDGNPRVSRMAETLSFNANLVKKPGNLMKSQGKISPNPARDREVHLFSRMKVIENLLLVYGLYPLTVGNLLGRLVFHPGIVPESNA